MLGGGNLQNKQKTNQKMFILTSACLKISLNAFLFNF